MEPNDNIIYVVILNGEVYGPILTGAGALNFTEVFGGELKLLRRPELVEI